MQSKTPRKGAIIKKQLNDSVDRYDIKLHILFFILLLNILGKDSSNWTSNKVIVHFSCTLVPIFVIYVSMFNFLFVLGKFSRSILDTSRRSYNN